VPRIELPSGAWVEYRDKLKPGDRLATKGGVKATYNQDGTTTMPSGLTDIMIYALLERVITAWGGGALEGVPIPSMNVAGTEVFDIVFDGRLEDFDELVEAVSPLLEQILRPGPKQKTSPSS
jgi:hypothetical protein